MVTHRELVGVFRFLLCILCFSDFNKNYIAGSQRSIQSTLRQSLCCFLLLSLCEWAKVGDVNLAIVSKRVSETERKQFNVNEIKFTESKNKVKIF